MPEIVTSSAQTIPLSSGGFNVPNSPIAVRSNADLSYYATSVLPEDAQRLVEDVVIKVDAERLVLVQDLIEDNLILDLGEDWWGIMEVGYDREHESGEEAHHAMVPGVQGQNFRNVFDRKVTPVHCTFKPFFLNIRELRASERFGRPLDTNHIATAFKKVNEKIEKQGWKGAGFSVAGNTAEGVLDVTDTVEFSSGEGWDDTGHSGEDIYDDIKRMLQKMEDKDKPGPYNLYLPWSYMLKLGDDWKANSDKSIITRLTELPLGGRPLRFRVADQITAHHVALVQMSTNTIQLIYGQAPTPYSWTAGNPWMFNNVAMACQVVQVRYDSNGGTGIVIGHKTGA